ncbi:MAG TPA: adenosylcobinamide-phosphate synthase CbiB [Vicinamibacterales bacterium]|nr:adenosylcobinamide-phosphate synthase CbiB [Vicinamibacterales bacterium]
MAFGLTPPLAPDAWLLAPAVVLDLALGDPVYRWHPVRLIGGTLRATEGCLRQIGADGYVGGVALCSILVIVWVGGVSLIGASLGAVHVSLGWMFHLFMLYSLLALGDLLRHVRRIERAVERGDVDAARGAVSQLVGRDTAPMDGAACRRAAVESLSENLTDGYTSPLFWYGLGGLPALVLFKVVSTMDSMVGYKTPRYLRFGWCGARLDDVMNFVPARLTWLMIALVAAVVPGCSASKALRTGLAQHGVLPGPNSGWSEAAAAGAIQRRLVGPIYLHGVMVTETWLGDPLDPPLASAGDMRRTLILMVAVGIGASLAACAILSAAA